MVLHKPLKATKISIKLLIPFFMLMILTIVAVAAYNIMESTTAYADSSVEEIKKELGDNVEDKLNGLDLSDLQQFINGLDGKGGIGGDIKAFLKGIIKGEHKNGYSEYFALSMKTLLGGLTDILPLIVTIIGVAILFSIVNNMSSGFISKSTTEILYFVCYSTIIIMVVAKVGNLIAVTVGTISNIQKLMQITFPILLTLITALGGAVTVSTYQPLMAVLSTGIITAINAVILPCFVAAMVLSIVGNLTKSIRLDKLNKFFKSLGEVLLGIMFSIFMTFVTMQGITGAVADNISVRSAKFAISSYVPILGGYLSEGFDLVMASIVLIKNSLGFTGVIVLLSVVLAPVLQLICFSLGLKLAAGIIEPIGDKRMSDIVYGISKNIVLLIVAMLGVAFMFFIMVMLVIYTCNLGV